MMRKNKFLYIAPSKPSKIRVFHLVFKPLHNFLAKLTMSLTPNLIRSYCMSTLVCNFWEVLTKVIDQKTSTRCGKILYKAWKFTFHLVWSTKVAQTPFCQLNVDGLLYVTQYDKTNFHIHDQTEGRCWMKSLGMVPCYNFCHRTRL